MRRSCSRRPRRSRTGTRGLRGSHRRVSMLTDGYSIVRSCADAAARQRRVRPALPAAGRRSGGATARSRSRRSPRPRASRPSTPRSSCASCGSAGWSRACAARRAAIGSRGPRRGDQRLERARGARRRLLLRAVLRVPRRASSASACASSDCWPARALARGTGRAARHARAHPASPTCSATNARWPPGSTRSALVTDSSRNGARPELSEDPDERFDPRSHRRAGQGQPRAAVHEGQPPAAAVRLLGHRRADPRLPVPDYRP